jgi:ribosomal protein L14
MITESMVFINADNSGSRLIKCVKIIKDKKGKTRLGNFIKVSLKKYVDKKKLKKRTIYNGMPCFIKSGIKRADGVFISGGSNKCLLFTDSFKFLGTRGKGLMFRELKNNSLLFKVATKVIKYHTNQV